MATSTVCAGPASSVDIIVKGKSTQSLKDGQLTCKVRTSYYESEAQATRQSNGVMQCNLPWEMSLAPLAGAVQADVEVLLDLGGGSNSVLDVPNAVTFQVQSCIDYRVATRPGECWGETLELELAGESLEGVAAPASRYISAPVTLPLASSSPRESDVFNVSMNAGGKELQIGISDGTRLFSTPLSNGSSGFIGQLSPSITAPKVFSTASSIVTGFAVAVGGYRRDGVHKGNYNFLPLNIRSKFDTKLCLDVVRGKDFECIQSTIAVTFKGPSYFLAKEMSPAYATCVFERGTSTYEARVELPVTGRGKGRRIQVRRAIVGHDKNTAVTDGWSDAQ